MIEIIIAIAIIGSVVSGLWDLKTTEVPDPIPIGMVVAGIVFWGANWLIKGDLNSLAVSLAIGTMLLVAGLILYKKGQWGGADAWILAAIGYMIPVYRGEIFIVPYLFNFMIVSIVYTVIYSVVIGFIHASVFSYVKKDFIENKLMLAGIPASALFVLLLASVQFPQAIVLVPGLLPLIILLVLFWRYALVIEKHVFKKRIATSKLKVGDVLEKGNWVGLTEKQIHKLRHEKRHVVIKDGMRFVPVFAIALVITLLFGNIFFAIF